MAVVDPVDGGPRQAYPLGIPGVRQYDAGTTSYPWQFVLGSDADDATLARLVESLPEGTSLSFYDRNYPSPSDPGAYANVTRDGDRYCIQHGNHGWTTAKEPIAAGDLVDYFRRCAPFNRGREADEVMIFHRPPAG